MKKVVIYTMGKVGSSTIVRSLQASGISLPLHHIHFLTHENIDRIEKSIMSSYDPVIPKHITESKLLRQELDLGLSKNWKIIALVRDPIARNISNFYENIHLWLPEFEYRWQNSILEADEIRSLFLNSLQHETPLSWFDEEFNRALNIDIYSSDFPKSEGFQIYRGNHPNILVIKVERLNDIHKEAFYDFMEISDFKLTSANVSEKKPHYAYLKQILAGVNIDGDFIQKMYESKYVKHFYTDKEIDEWKKLREI